MNNDLESNDTHASMCRGEQFIIKGLLETIETSIGEEEAKKVAYETGIGLVKNSVKNLEEVLWSVRLNALLNT